MFARRTFHQAEEKEGEPLKRAQGPELQIFATCRPSVHFCHAATERDTRAAKREVNCTKPPVMEDRGPDRGRNNCQRPCGSV